MPVCLSQTRPDVVESSVSVLNHHHNYRTHHHQDNIPNLEVHRVSQISTRALINYETKPSPKNGKGNTNSNRNSTSFASPSNNEENVKLLNTRKD